MIHAFCSWIAVLLWYILTVMVTIARRLGKFSNMRYTQTVAVYNCFRELKKKKKNLQDTHFDPKLENYVRSEWEHMRYLASYSSQSKGGGMLFYLIITEFKVKKYI